MNTTTVDGNNFYFFNYRKFLYSDVLSQVYGGGIVMIQKLNAIANLIGRTPMLKLEKIALSNDASLYIKLEYMNPGGSHKDRAAYYMIKDALEKGMLKERGRIIEVSSGNTALSLAWMAARLNLKSTFIVEEEFSEVKVAALRLLGADIIRVEESISNDEDPRFVKARELERKLGGVFLNQFSNEANFRAHYETTAEEIIEQMGKEIHAFIMGIGTGGTIAGVGKRLKEEIGKDVQVIGVVPKGSKLLHGKAFGQDRIAGLAKDIKPEIYLKHRDYIDKVIEIGSAEAISVSKKLAGEEGLLVGPSTGAMVAASIKIAGGLEPKSKIVTIAADSIFRYNL